jgi:cation:H+ antiporter
MAATGLAIVAAAYFLSWATEALQTVVSQAFALAILALIQVLPEYSFEVVLAWKQQLQFAAATMTGANRLLMGFGWPLVFFVAVFSAWRKHEVFSNIKLDKHQSVEVLFLLISTLYSIVILLRHRIILFDSVILIGIYAIYIIIILRLPPERGEMELARSTGAKIVHLRGWKKIAFVSGLLLFGFTVVLFGAEPFIESMKKVATSLGIPQFQFIQWFAPFLSEFPESLTAFIWASTIIMASMGLANLISSKVNQWTLLIASIPIFYSLSLGRAGIIPLDTLQMHELMLTTAQTIYGSVCLLGLCFKRHQAYTLIILFSIQFFFAETRLWIAGIYIGLAALELILQRKEIAIFRVFWEIMKSEK